MRAPAARGRRMALLDSSAMRGPDFFIVGAPKCGTTALARYLSEHDRIHFSSHKEPQYFARHLWVLPSYRDVPSFRNSLEHYLALFEGAGEHHLAVGEASTRYLMSERALEEIARFAPEGRVIAMLRNPVEMAYSYHSELYFHGIEVEGDFERAWDLQTERAQGRNVPASMEADEMLLYAKVCRLGEQVEWLQRIFPPERRLLIFHDDFKRDAGGVYRQVLEFLGVPDDGREVFPVVNANKQINQAGPWLRRLKGSPRLRLASDRLKAALGIDSWGVVARVQQHAKTEDARKPLSPEMRARLIEEFRPDVERLAAATGRDLSHWLAEPEAPRASA